VIISCRQMVYVLNVYSDLDCWYLANCDKLYVNKVFLLLSVVWHTVNVECL
jgi:hypothetical protein